jgi:hypothetical protein
MAFLDWIDERRHAVANTPQQPTPQNVKQVHAAQAMPEPEHRQPMNVSPEKQKENEQRFARAMRYVDASQRPESRPERDVKWPRHPASWER